MEGGWGRLLSAECRLELGTPDNRRWSRAREPDEVTCLRNKTWSYNATPLRMRLDGAVNHLNSHNFGHIVNVQIDDIPRLT